VDPDALRAQIDRLDEVVAALHAAVGEAAEAEAPDDAAAEESAWDASGLWKGEIVEEESHIVTLQLHQDGDAVAGSLIVAYELDEEPYCAVETVAGTVTGRDVWLSGTTVSFMPPDPEADYSMDVLEMTMFAKGAEMSGRWKDVDGDANGRVQLRRAAD
jgi:hypothetical protein